MKFIEIRCQEKRCPYKRQIRCCFGEIDQDCMSGKIVEKHKCKYAKAGGLQYVIVHIPVS